jgi:quercetin dioxygenase-like cupin family protein
MNEESLIATATTPTASTEEAPQGLVIEAGQRQALNIPGGALTFMARGEQTGGAATAWESTVAPGYGPPLHSHVREDEMLYVLQGRLGVRLGATIHEASVGSFVFIPRGVPHTWQNAGDDTARFLVLFTPAAAGMERFFERSAKLGEAPQVAEAFKRFASDAGMEVLGPPLAQPDPVA